MAVAALIFGILSIVFCWVPVLSWVMLALAIMGIIFAAVSIPKASKNGKGKGLPIAALVLCIIGAILCGALTIALGGAVAALM